MNGGSLTAFLILYVFSVQCILCFVWLEWRPVHYGSYVFPYWTNILGWVVSIVPVLFIPIVGLAQFVMAKGSFVQVVYTAQSLEGLSLFTDILFIVKEKMNVVSEVALGAEPGRRVGTSTGRPSGRTLPTADSRGQTTALATRS